MDPSPEACAQVGRAGEDVTQPLIPHELPSSLLDQTLHLTNRHSLFFIKQTGKCFLELRLESDLRI